MNQYENAYFHGLAGNVVVMNADELIINLSIEQLDNIIKTGGIFSRNMPRESIRGRPERRQMHLLCAKRRRTRRQRVRERYYGYIRTYRWTGGQVS